MAECSAVIDNLVKGHGILLSTINQMQTCLRSYSAIKPQLQEFEGQVFGHLGQQNKELFEQLSEYFREDRQKLKMIEFLTVNLKDIKIKALTLFDQFPAADKADRYPGLFPKQFTDFTQELMARIKLEGEYLLPLLEQYNLP